LPQLESDPESVARLRREAVIAARLEHPNVCPITDMGETPEGHLYLVMPFLPGEPLAVHQFRHGPLSVTEAIPLLVGVCHGLGHAHWLKILHRDLKPENIMLVPDGDAAGGIRAVVMDFGLAKVVREEPDLQKLTRSGIVLGTPEFMSPEQFAAAPPRRATRPARDAGARDRPGAGADAGGSVPVHGRAERGIGVGRAPDVTYYSPLSDSIGSTRDARRAGR
jgi:serine/threonine protein kinase